MPYEHLTFIAAALWDEVKVLTLFAVWTPSTGGTWLAEPTITRVVGRVHGVWGGGACCRGCVRERAAGVGSPCGRRVLSLRQLDCRGSSLGKHVRHGRCHSWGATVRMQEASQVCARKNVMTRKVSCSNLWCHTCTHCTLLYHWQQHS